MTKYWTNEEKRLVLELAGDKLASQIVEELVKNGYPKRSASAIRSMMRREEEHANQRQDYVEDEMIVDKYQEALKHMSELRAEALINITDYTEVIGNPKNANMKVLSISDTHIPFYHDKVIQEAVSKHSDADILVLNGDILELYTVSKWPKSRSIILRHEYKIALTWLRKLANIFPKVILTRGNHEYRLQSYFQSNVDPVVNFMTEPDILHRLANGYDFNEDNDFEKTYNLPNVYYNKGQLCWFAQVGKAIFAHPSSGSSVPMKTAIKAAEWFVARNYDFEALIIGHTHQMGSLIWNNKLLIEQGCACVPLEYEATSRMAYRPQSFGYATIYLDKDGHVDFDKSRPVYYGTGSVTANNILHIGD